MDKVVDNIKESSITDVSSPIGVHIKDAGYTACRNHPTTNLQNSPIPFSLF